MRSRVVESTQMYQIESRISSIENRLSNILLKTVTASIKKNKSSVKKKTSIVRWSDDEKTTLKFLYNKGLCIYQIGAILDRTPNAVMSKLRSLNIIDHYYNARGFDKLLKSYKDKGCEGFVKKVENDKNNALMKGIKKIKV